MTRVLNQPLGGNTMPRFGGLASMMRLPVASSAAGLDAAFIGIPLDIGTSHRPGTRFGPRQIRVESALIRPYNMATGAAPFDALQVADLGDVPINTYSLEKSLPIITDFYREVLSHGCRPLTAGAVNYLGGLGQSQSVPGCTSVGVWHQAPTHTDGMHSHLVSPQRLRLAAQRRGGIDPPLGHRLRASPG